MPTGNAKFEAAANEAGCQFLAAAGGAAAQFTAYSLLTGSLVTGAAGAAVTGIAAYAYAKNCQWDSNEPQPDNPYLVELSCCPPNVQTRDGQWYWTAKRVSDGFVNKIYIGYSFNDSGQYNKGEIIPPSGPGQDGSWRLTGCGYAPNPSGIITDVWFSDAWTDLRIHGPDSQPCGPGPLPPVPGPFTYTDPDDGCQIEVTFQAWAVDGGGNYGPVWKMEPKLPPAARAGGGIIGDCNFTPVIYYDPPGGGGGGPYFPIPPEQPSGDPWWMDVLQSLLGGLGAFAAEKLFEKLFEEKLPAGSRSIYAACEYKEDGTPEEYTVNFPEESWADRVLTAFNADVDFQQQILLWKTPTCPGSPPTPLTGDPVSINWVSDEYSPFGNDRIRKLLTYFDQKNTSLADTVAHWKDFTWDAGSVIVSVNGVPLGRPQVWAATAEEGKRVINHAAAIAGVDMTNAEWLITTPRASRYGQTGKMRVHRSTNGVLGITKRDGPSGSPEGLI